MHDSGTPAEIETIGYEELRECMGAPSVAVVDVLPVATFQHGHIPGAKNLHLVLSELQTIATMCGDDSVSAERVRIRAESTLAIFEGELRTVHDLLYRPEQMPDEQVLESILASLAAGLEVLGVLLGCMPAESRGSPVFRSSLRHVRLRAVEICADCVPREYAPHLADWMNRVQQLASPLA